MINRYVAQIEIEGGEIHFIENVSNYILNYLYTTYSYVDSILLADDYAKSLNATTSSTEYLAALWEKTETLTNRLFEEASLSLGNLIYTAWITAGSPSFDDDTFSKKLNQTNFFIQSIYCNYPDSVLSIKYSLDQNMTISFDVLTMGGEKVTSLNMDSVNSGVHHSNINITGLSDGLYLFILNCLRTMEATGWHLILKQVQQLVVGGYGNFLKRCKGFIPFAWVIDLSVLY